MPPDDDRPARAHPAAPGPELSGRQAPAVECAELVVRYGSAIAVDGLSFTAHAGEVLAVLGPNGAGKTSTVESLEGYRRPSGGRLRVLGLDPAAEHRALVGRIGVMLQRGGVYPMLGPRRVLDLFARYYPDPEDPGDLLRLVGLEEVARTPWHHLSGGEQQRLALALALVGRPEVVFLDEPTAGVDTDGRQAIRRVVSGLAERGACVLLTTHELAEAETMADRVLIVRQGRSVFLGSPADLTTGAAGGGPIVSFGARPGLDTAALALALGAEVAELRPGRYRVNAEGTPRLTAALATWLAERGAALSELRAGRTLEEAYLGAIGQPEGGTDGTDPDHRPDSP